MHFPQSFHSINAPPQPDATIESEQRQPYVGHAHFWERALSRRQVITTAAVSAGTAAALSSGLFAPVLADARHASSAPKPIPEVIMPGTPFHVLSPGSEEPSTIYDFNGFIGATEIQGHGSHDLLFDADMRFMQGTYIGVDGHVHQGVFGFVWLDLFKGQFDFTNFSTQVHDFNPGIHPYPAGLFWTVRIPTDAVHVNLGAGTASLRVAGQHVHDFFNLPNSLSNGHSVGATVSYAIRWHGVKKRRHVHNETLHVAGLFLDTHATIDWTGHNANGFHFASDDEGQTVVSAQIGHERNGVFFS